MVSKNIVFEVLYQIIFEVWRICDNFINSKTKMSLRCCQIQSSQLTIFEIHLQ